MKDAQAKEAWFRREYNAVRPHSSIGVQDAEGVQCGVRRKGN